MPVRASQSIRARAWMQCVISASRQSAAADRSVQQSNSAQAAINLYNQNFPDPRAMAGPWSPTCLPQALHPRSPKLGVVLHLCGHPPTAEKLRAALPTSEPGQGESLLGALTDAHCITLGILEGSWTRPSHTQQPPQPRVPYNIAGSLGERSCGHIASRKAFTLLLLPRELRVTHPHLPGAQGTQRWGTHQSHKQEGARNCKQWHITCNKSKPTSVFSPHKL